VFTIVDWLLVLVPLLMLCIGLATAARTGARVGGTIVAFTILETVAIIVTLATVFLVAWIALRVPFSSISRAVGPSQLTAITTRSSLATIPVLMTGIERELPALTPVAAYVVPIAGGLLKLSRAVSGSTKFLFLAAALHVNRESIHGLREVQRLKVKVIFVVRIVQDGVVMNVFHLGDGADIAGDARIHFQVLAALDLEQMAHLERFARIADEQLAVGFHGSLVHAEDAELAHERVVADLEHVGDHVCLRSGLTTTSSTSLPSPLRIGGGCLQRVGHQVLAAQANC
jgi:hypothetical protein